jgi:hypothetical protein
MFISLYMQTVSEKGFMNGRRIVLFAAVILLVLMLTRLEVFHGPAGNRATLASSGSVAVYSDSGCSQPVNAVNWGALSPGGVKNVVVYVRNEGDSPVVLVVLAMNWTPADAESCLVFSWNHQDLKLMPAEVGEVILTLNVAYELNITNFSFNILFEGLNGLPTDTNQDGKVDTRDFASRTILGRLSGTQAAARW